jgi:hypothetical protein
LLSVAVLTALLGAGCCMGGATPLAPAPVTPPPVPSMPVLPPGMPPMPGMPGMPPAGAALPGAGMLPTPALSFVGVDGPMPVPGLPAGTPGAIRTSGTATVAIASGSLPGVTSGTVCSYVQYEVDAAATGFPCRWNVTCGTSVVYGLGGGGYQVCTSPAWPPGVLMMDPNMSSSDSDPMFIFNAGGITVGDDTGPLGAFTLTMTHP